MTVLITAGCASSSSGGAHAPSGPPAVDEKEVVAKFAQVEDDALGWLAAADPRLATRESATPPDSVLKSIGTEAILAEDTAADIRGNSLDLFAFRARARALDEARKRLASFGDRLPDSAPAGQTLTRPRLERELLARLIDEEQARVADEAKLTDASGELVRAIVATWTPLSTPQDWPERDAWVSKHLLEIRDSLRRDPSRTGPLDLDVALYPLERLLAPLQFPRGSAAIAELRVGLDADPHVPPPLVLPERLAHGAKIHLGVSVDSKALLEQFSRTEARLRELVDDAVAESAVTRRNIEARARELLFAEHPCPAVPETRVRSMGPPPERAAICGALRALTEEPARAAALMALHDDVLIAAAAVTSAPPPRTGLLCHPEDDVVDAMRRMARERPLVVIGVALAADLLYGPKTGADERLRTWRALGEAPLDIVAREMSDPNTVVP